MCEADIRQKAQKSIEEAIFLLRNKSPESTMVERYKLLYEACDSVQKEKLSQPLQKGKGLYYILARVSLPMKAYDLLLGRYDDHVPTEEEQKMLDALWQTSPSALAVTKGNGGHRTMDWETLLKKGITGYLSQAEKRLEKAHADGETENAADFLEGMIWSYRGILLYIERYGEAAREAGLADCAAVCENLTKGAPKTFREALQLILFIYNIYLIYAGSLMACLTVGRLDNLLLPFYEKDIATGILTEEEAGAFIDDFSAKMSLHLGRGEHQLAPLEEGYVYTGRYRNPVWDAPGYIVIGGYSNITDHKTNPLTLLFARHIHPQLKNPVYICRYTSDCYDELWDTLCEKIQKNAALLLYNDETMIRAQKYIGVEERDAIDYSVHPCNWPDIMGDSFVEEMCGEPLPVVLNRALGRAKPFESMDAIYEEAKAVYAEIIRPAFARYRERRAADRSDENFFLLDDCFAKGVIPAARALYSGGAKYPALYVLLRNIGTAADMLCAIDTLVFKEKSYTLAELLKAAEEDFENDEALLSRCRKAPKYGTDNADADAHACRLMNEILDVIDREATNGEGVRDVYTLHVTISDSHHIYFGAKTPATVDGRRNGKPFSENLGPTVGYAKGITALLNSVSKLPFDRIHGGAFNVRIGRKEVEGREGARRIKALLKTYFEKGGMQIQFSVADTKELKKAQENPDDFRDLMVRITGYSAIFVDMSRGGQEEIIRREELQ